MYVLKATYKPACMMYMCMQNGYNYNTSVKSKQECLYSVLQKKTQNETGTTSDFSTHNGKEGNRKDTN